MSSAQLRDLLKKSIVEDIFENHRSFLDGNPCTTPEQVLEKMEGSILVDDLDTETVCLMLSTLPLNAEDLYLKPLDKGLSGSLVYAARCSFHGSHNRSKTYVFKIGRMDKLEDEYRKVETIVSPSLRAVSRPVFRRGRSKALVSQEFAGLSDETKLRSLRECIREDSDGPDLIRKLLEGRLGRWYRPHEPESRLIAFSELFVQHIEKFREKEPYEVPESWELLLHWVQEVTGRGSSSIQQMVDNLSSHHVDLVRTISHGDLHSQNVLVDENHNCWPIDFAWTTEDSSPLVDLTMLECSLKFLALPRRSDLRTLFRFEQELSRDPDSVTVGNVPYRDEIKRVYASVAAIRDYAASILNISQDDYLKALLLLTCTLSNHPLLNQPYVIASTQILASATDL